MDKHLIDLLARTSLLIYNGKDFVITDIDTDRGIVALFPREVKYLDEACVRVLVPIDVLLSDKSLVLVIGDPAVAKSNLSLLSSIHLNGIPPHKVLLHPVKT